MKMLILNNPRAAGWIILALMLVFGVSIGFLLFRMGMESLIKKRINQYSENAIDRKNMIIDNQGETIANLSVEVAFLKAKISRTNIFLAKAISEHGTITNDRIGER